MKKITVVGIGTCPETLTAQGLRAIENADVLIGGKLTTDQFTYLNKKVYAEWEASKTKAIIDSEAAENIAVLVSGDVGFYSGAELLVKALTDCDVALIPGISTVQAFFAKIKLPWKEAALVSMHGREHDIVGEVRRNQYTFCLTAKDKRYVYEPLIQYGFGSLRVYLGENLGSGRERVFETTVSELETHLTTERTVLVVANPNFDDRVRYGIVDDNFTRADKIPMTKAEVRAVVMSKLAISPSDICFDIGCGTGSVSVEMALAAYHGKVFALDKLDAAIKLTEENAVKFHVGNIITVPGDASRTMEALPAPDVVFVGGNGGRLHEIIEKAGNARLCITSITLETAYNACEILKGMGRPFGAARISVERGSRILKAENSVMVIWTES